MNKFSKLFFFCLVAVVNVCFVQKARAQKNMALYCVGFYNQENLFDTIHDHGKNDYEYLPDGANHWTGLKYRHKLKNMSTVLSQMGEREVKGKDGSTRKVLVPPAIIGLSEVENRRVLEDLIAQPALKDRGLEILHVEGPDKRGVDCAFLINPKVFKLTSTNFTNYVYENGDTARKTRGFLMARGQLAGEDVTVIVNHWPSRGAVSEFREMAGRQVRRLVDSLQKENDNMKIIIMGDLNDDPDNASLTKGLGAKWKMDEVGKHGLYNPWYDVLRKQGKGTLAWDGAWNLFDQIIVTGNMLNGKDYTTLSYLKPEIFSREYMFQTEGKYKGSPKRTHASGVWLDGYSDHLPTLVWLVKEVK